MSLVKELDDNESIPYWCISTFSYRLLSNSSMNYYVNDINGFSIYDQDWILIRIKKIK